MNINIHNDNANVNVNEFVFYIYASYYMCTSKLKALDIQLSFGLKQLQCLSRNG